jgi:hypothetical protein
MAPLQLILPRELDERKHIVDSMAQKYLQQASKSVQHLVPIKSVADGNCLFNSIISLLPDSNLSAVELRGLSHLFNTYRNVRRMYVTILF